MADETPFVELIRRVRAGDDQAATELEGRYGPAIRREVRLRLRNRRVTDSADICQSVMRSFFVRAAVGQFELDKPEQLMGLLRQMARNRLTDALRRQTAAKRDEGRNQPLVNAEGDAVPVAAPGPSPSKVVAWKELLELVYAKLPEKERAIAKLRAQGMEWTEIAAQLGGSADAARMRLNRAIELLAPELGLDE